MKITQDIHVHTNLSRCASREATVENYIDAWCQIGVDTVGIADHFWDERMPIPCPGRTRAFETQAIWDLKEHVKSLDTKGVRVLFGAETEYDYTNRGVAIHPETAAQLDFLLVPHDHSHLTSPVDLRDEPKKHARFILDAWYDILNSNVVQYITSMAHPFITNSPTEVTLELSDKEISDAVLAAKQAGVAIEINCAALYASTKNRQVGELLALDNMRMLMAAKEFGCKFTFATDAHHADHCRLMTGNYAIALYLGLTDADVKLI